METYYILQRLIYAFNEDLLRNGIMTKACRDAPSTVRWKGTVRLHRNARFTQFRGWRLASQNHDKTIVFTASYVYRRNRVHYVAFVLEPSKRRLTCFDPGYDLYLYGRHKIIPMVANALHDAGWIDAPIILQGPCTPKTQHGFGIQYNGKNPRKVTLPADAFCQMWTLFFLSTYVRHDGNLSFFDEWCRIKPQQREFFLIQNFILPILQSCLSSSSRSRKRVDVSKEDVLVLEGYVLQSFWTRLK